MDQSYPSIHNSRLYLDPSRQSRGHGQGLKDDPQQHTPLQPNKPNGSIYFTSPHLNPGQDTPSSPIMSPPHQSQNTTGTSHGSQQSPGAAYRQGVLRSLSLLSVLSLLLALNSLVFLLKIVWPLNMSGEKYYPKYLYGRSHVICDIFQPNLA